MPGAAQIDEPPSPAKTELIRRFLAATGIQHQIDSGSFLEPYAFPGSPLIAKAAEGGTNYLDAIKAALAALRTAYEPHRQAWLDEYVIHVNWEFTEGELERIVSFLETPDGQHFMEGRSRMHAYIGTNTEHLVEEIIGEAQSSLSKR